jgi:hypothetical protein
MRATSSARTLRRCVKTSSGSSQTDRSIFQALQRQEQDVLDGELRGYSYSARHRQFLQRTDAGSACWPVLDTHHRPNYGSTFPQQCCSAGRYSRLAKLGIERFFPAPNINLPQGNYRLTTSLPNDIDQQTYRIDQNLGRLGTIFGRGTTSNFSINTLGNPNANVLIGQNFFVQDTTNWAISHTITFGPTIVNQFRFGYLEATANQGSYPADPADISALGLTGVFTNLSPPQRVYPSINMTGGYTGVGGAINAYTTSNQPMWDFADSMTWVRGNHTLGFGIEYRRWKLNRDLADNFLGNFNFNGFATGNSVADMLLGYYSGAAVFQPGGFSVGDLTSSIWRPTFRTIGK